MPRLFIYDSFFTSSDENRRILNYRNQSGVKFLMSETKFPFSEIRDFIGILVSVTFVSIPVTAVLGVAVYNLSNCESHYIQNI